MRRTPLSKRITEEDRFALADQRNLIASRRNRREVSYPVVGARGAGARFTNARVYGLSAWGVRGEAADQSNLVITRDEEDAITVDNLKVAQFIYLLIRNREVREVVETVTSKVVLILGRFTPKRKHVLDNMRQVIRSMGMVPILFDFARPQSRDTMETVYVLAGLAKFVIADLTDAKSVLQELQAIVPSYPSLPVQPILIADQDEPGMFDHIRRVGPKTVLPTVYYSSESDLVDSLLVLVVQPASVNALALRPGAVRRPASISSNRM
jgi:hypothetical protein